MLTDDIEDLAEIYNTNKHKGSKKSKYRAKKEKEYEEYKDIPYPKLYNKIVIPTNLKQMNPTEQHNKTTIALTTEKAYKKPFQVAVYLIICTDLEGKYISIVSSKLRRSDADLDLKIYNDKNILQNKKYFIQRILADKNSSN